MRRLRVAALALFAGAALSVGVAAAEQVPVAPKLEVTDRFPTAGRATTIVTPAAVEMISVTYSPTSRVEKREVFSVQKLNPAGAYNTVWRPQRPGVARIEAAGEQRTVSVRFDSLPVSGMVIMLIAALVLFGGAALSLRSLLREHPLRKDHA